MTRRWTASEEAVVARPLAGETLETLAARVGRTPQAVRERRLVLRHRGAALDPVARFRAPRVPRDAPADPAADRLLFRRFMASLPADHGTAEDLLANLRRSGSWRTLARTWLDGRRVSA